MTVEDGLLVSERLPSNRTAFEEAIAGAMSDRLPIPFKLIMDPATAPVEWLPFLAAHRSVDLWYSDWSTARKRLMIGAQPRIAWLKGARAGTRAYLEFVDVELLDVISYPTRFIIGRAVIGRTPIGHQPFVARHLVRVRTVTPPRAFVMGRAVIGRSVLRTPSREPFNRALAAMRVAKAPETEYRADFAHKRQLLLSDGPLLSDDLLLGAYINRSHL